MTRDHRFGPAGTGATNPRIEPPAVRGAATVFSDYLAVLGARVGSVLLSLVSVVMTTRILAPAGYGLVAYLSVMGTLIFTITSAWTSTAVSRYGREELETAGDMVAVTWARIALTAPLVLCAAAVVAALKLLGALPRDFGWLYVCLAVGSGVSLITAEHVIYIMEAAGRIKQSAAGLFIRQAAVVATLVVIFVTATGRSVVAVALISILSSFLLTLAFGAAVWRVAFWPPRLDRALLRRIVVFSLPLVAFTVSQYVIRSVDVFVIGASGTTADVGTYAVAYQAYSVLQGIAAATGPVLTPLFVSLRHADKTSVIERYVKRVIPQMLFVSSCLAGLAAPFATLLVPFVFGSRFSGARAPLAVLLCALVLFFVASLLASVLVLYERTRAIAGINIAAAAINVVGDVVLISVLHVGIVGAAIATSLSLLCVCAGYFYVARSSVNSGDGPNPALLIPLLLGVGTALSTADVRGLALGLLATGVTAILLARATSIFSMEDVAMLEKLDIPARPKAFLIRSLRATSGRRRRGNDDA